ncbi:MAG: response regulator [Planctomycetes bacterium]|nr:response regulator [Planctomycetota bacterium]
MRRARIPLARRLGGLCTLLTAVAVGLVGAHTYRRETAVMAEATLRDLQTLARMVGVNVRSGLEFGAREAVDEFLRTAVATLDLQAAAVVERGLVVAAGGDPTLVPLAPLAAPGPIGEDWVGFAPLVYQDASGATRQAQVVVRTSGAPLQQRLHDYLHGFAWATLTVLVGLGVAAQWLLRRLLRPIAALVRTTDRVRRTEDYSLRAEAAANDEIGDLVQAWNAMLAAIQDRDTHLGSIAQDLERQVAERTAELTRALAAAELATKSKSTFVANISHEIRTPLNAILGMAELAAETDDPGELREYLAVIRSAGTSLLGILSDVLDLAKIESGRFELSPVPTDVETLVLEALRPLFARIHNGDVDLVFELGAEVAAGYRLDDVRCRQILTNLVGNAIKFTERGAVRVRLDRIADRGQVHLLELVVEDTGVGIPPDRLEAVFQPFTQADNTITRRFAGTGLGLSITDRLTRLMGGEISVQSTVGVGTTFRVRLPLEVCASPSPPVAPPPAGTRLRLLTASGSTRDSLAAIARRLGVELLPLADLDQLAAAGPLPPHDVVLVDDRDAGPDAGLAAMLPVGGRGTRPVLLLTSFQDLPRAAARCRAHQLAGYLPRPVSGRELATRLQAILGVGAGQGPAPAPAAPGADRTPGLRILVAEDNPMNQKVIERLLQRDGHTVTLAADGRACCDLFADGGFDLVLMDVQMPAMSGLEATRRIREREAATGCRVPIVALTANTTPEDREACLQAGMDDVLPKPVPVPRLRALLARFRSGDEGG